MKTLLNMLLSLNSLKKNLGFASIFSATKFDHHRQIIKDLKYKRVLVLAPHPDDDIFGIGGTLKKLIVGGAAITVAYFCDGSGGVIEGEDEAGSLERIDKNLIAVRKAEAREAALILGIQKQVFFGYRDGKLASGSAAVKALHDLIDSVKPEIIFVPSFLDNHPDHRVVNEILINLISQKQNLHSVEIWAYEIWTPLFPNRIVIINDSIEAKKKAMAAHKSQIKARGYSQAILGLNQYRAEINNYNGFAEAFFATTAEIYRKLYRKS